MADCLGPSMVVHITEVSLIWRAIIERFHCSSGTDPEILQEGGLGRWLPIPNYRGKRVAG